jgi:hypothetical protein
VVLRMEGRTGGRRPRCRDLAVPPRRVAGGSGCATSVGPFVGSDRSQSQPLMRTRRLGAAGRPQRAGSSTRPLVVAHSLPDANPPKAQTALTVQPVHVEQTASFHRVAPQPARPSRSEPVHHPLPFFPKSSGKFPGAIILIPASAATASALRPAYQAEQQPECSQTCPALPMPTGKRGLCEA